MVESFYTDRDFIQKLKVRYAFAIGLIALVLMVSYGYLHFQLEQNEDYAQIINVSGRQRMLSQRIAYFSNRLAKNVNSVEANANAIEIYTLLQEFQSNHDMLLEAVQSKRKGSKAASDLNTIYYGEDQSLDVYVTAYSEKILQFLQDYRYVIGGGYKGDFTTNVDLNQALSLAEGPLLVRLNDAVLAFKAETERAIRRFQRIEFFVFLIGVLTLISEVFIIFRPILRLTEDKLNILRLAQKEAELAQAMQREFLLGFHRDFKIPFIRLKDFLSYKNMDSLGQKEKEKAQADLQRIDILLSSLIDMNEQAARSSWRKDQKDITFTEIFVDISRNLDPLIKEAKLSIDTIISAALEQSMTKQGLLLKRAFTVLLLYLIESMPKDGALTLSLNLCQDHKQEAVFVITCSEIFPEAAPLLTMVLLEQDDKDIRDRGITPRLLIFVINLLKDCGVDIVFSPPAYSQNFAITFKGLKIT